MHNDDDDDNRDIYRGRYKEHITHLLTTTIKRNQNKNTTEVELLKSPIVGRRTY